LPIATYRDIYGVNAAISGNGQAICRLQLQQEARRVHLHRLVSLGETAAQRRFHPPHQPGILACSRHLLNLTASSRGKQSTSDAGVWDTFASIRTPSCTLF